MHTLISLSHKHTHTRHDLYSTNLYTTNGANSLDTGGRRILFTFHTGSLARIIRSKKTCRRSKTKGCIWKFGVPKIYKKTEG
ncbi:hypothetical protein EON63_14625 [archaeon]|nr:MAG: hypothetical protein EON63_14625 [archaeon]